jgi:hypothetical protein
MEVWNAERIAGRAEVMDVLGGWNSGRMVILKVGRLDGLIDGRMDSWAEGWKAR